MPLMALVALLALPLGASAACLFECALTSGEAVGTIQAACTQWAERMDRHEDKFRDCVRICRLKGTAPNSAGHCGGTRECLGRCRSLRAVWTARATARARRVMRRSCGSVISPCRISRRTTREACALLVPEPTPVPASGLPSSDEDDTCRPVCVADKLKICYAECADACGSDEQALHFCHQACRNRGCAAIVQLCGCEEGIDCERGSPSTTSTSTSTTTTVTVTTTTLSS
jgi:hypothetical protein